jgi:hypothetical protein
VQPRDLVLGAALLLIGALAVLTVLGAVNNGINGLVIISVVILAVLGFGVLGALTENRDE